MSELNSSNNPVKGIDRPFRILVDHGGYEFRNMGDVGMLQALVERIQEYLPNSQFFIFAREPRRLNLYCRDAVPVSVEGREIWLQERNLFGALYRVCPRPLETRLAHYEADLRVHHVSWAARRIERRLGKRGVNVTSMREFLAGVLGADALVVAGGSFFTDAFAWQADRILETIRLTARLQKPVGLFGQGLGPLESPLLLHKLWESIQAARVLALREETRSRALLRQIGTAEDTAVFTGDDTVELAYREKKETLGEALGVNMRFARYSGVTLREVGEVRRTLAFFARRVKAPVYGIPISRHAGDSDVATAEMLLRSIPNVRDCGEKLDTPRAVIRRIGECRTVVTGAYHGAVYALSQGIPVVALVKSQYYRNKFEGLRDQFGEGCLILYFDQPDFLTALETALNRQWESAPRQRDRLLSIAQEQVAKGQEVYRRFCHSLTTHSPSIEAA